jgi:large subunit ribosomal protein L18
MRVRKHTGRKSVARIRRHRRVRTNIAGTAEKPRLVVFRSIRHIYAQVIDDDKGHTLVATSTLEKELKTEVEAAGKPNAVCKLIGKTIAQKALDKGIKQVVFDRGGYIYHGNIKALAEGAREAGLQF